ncbi:MAG: hypothetical protein M1837_002777 [Sclerophora amabilis]|nr:MAG: hypothetical protein M1837_002777 [Sclerophora amabilis]
MPSNLSSPLPARNAQRLSQPKSQATYQNSPDAQQAQDALLTTDEESASASDGFSSSPSSSLGSQDWAPTAPSPAPMTEIMRCSRCQRSMSQSAGSDGNGALLGDWSTNASGMVRFGHNLYYCARCASMVGLKR